MKAKPDSILPGHTDKKNQPQGPVADTTLYGWIDQVHGQGEMIPKPPTIDRNQAPLIREKR